MYFRTSLGTVIQIYLGWRFSFIFLALIGIIAFILSSTFKETLVYDDRPLKPQYIINEYKQIISNKLFLSYH